nr:hypothetical protein [Tanacetum cinerariifolium]
MVNVIPPDHVDEVPVVEPNQHNDVPVVLEPILVYEDEDPKEDEFKEEEDPQEEEDDMKINIEKYEIEPKLTYPYEEMDPLNPPPTASESEPDVEIKVENLIKHDDETIPASVHEKRKAKDKFYGKLILELGNEVHSSVKQGTSAMEKLVEKLGNSEDKVECKKLKKELEEARFSNTFLRIQNEQVERDLYWTRVRAHEFYQEMIHRGFVFEERPNKAINIPIEDEKSPSSEPLESPLSRFSAIGCNDLYHLMKQCNYVLILLIMPLKSASMTQAAIRRIIKDSVNVAIAVERARQANVRNDASGSGRARGQDAKLAICECTFAGFMKCNPTVFHGVE